MDELTLLALERSCRLGLIHSHGYPQFSCVHPMLKARTEHGNVYFS